MIEQIPLSLSLQQRASFGNYFGEGCQSLIAQLKQFAQGEGQSLYLWGREGIGKSHLLYAMIRQAEQDGRRTALLPLESGMHAGVRLLEGCGTHDLVALDDLDAVAGRAEWEEGLFHLFNQLRDLGHQWVITAGVPLSDLPIQLPDLRSRLGEAVVEAIPVPNERERWNLLQRRAEARGMEMGDEVIAFLQQRTGRDPQTLLGLLEQLDQQTLATKRKVTIPFVKEIFGI